jgi:tetratricopeptide (TPR) repeat protein/class 3 adenylate cyclase
MMIENTPETVDSSTPQARDTDTDAHISEIPSPVEPARRNEQAVLSDIDEGSATEPVTAHVLFMDIVDSTKFPTNKQPQMLKRLLKIVRETEEYQRALSKEQLLRIPTGDGMALTFFTNNPMAAVRCAQQICKAIRESDAGFGLRLGIHSGPIYRLENIDDRPNVSGDGINIAQRVMDCGDAGHIMVSGAVADFLKSFEEWSGQLHDLKEVKIKNTRLRVFNLYDERCGNPKLPKKVRTHRRRRSFNISAVAIASLVLLSALAASIYFLLNRSRAENIQSVAILPLTSDGPETKELSNSITSEIITTLQSLSPELNVKPDASYPFESASLRSSGDVRAAAKLFNVQAVLYGTMRRQQDSFTITVEFIDARSNKPLWPAKVYTVPPLGTRDVAGLISIDLLRSLRGEAITSSAVKVSGDQRSHETQVRDEAHKLYAHGRGLLEERKIADSIASLIAATEKDPSYAEAYAALAEAYNLSPGYGVFPPVVSYEKAKTAADKALSLNANLPEAHVAKGYALANFDFNWPEAEKEFRRALELRPNSADALYAYAFQYLIPMGRIDEAIQKMEKARELSPLSRIINTNLGWTYYYARRYDKALEQYQKTLQIDPEFNRIHRRLLEFYEVKGRYTEALAERAKISTPEVVEQLRQSFDKGGAKAYWQKRLELSKAAAEREVVPKYDLAIVYASLEDKEKTLQLLEESYQERSDGLIKLGVNPRFDFIRNDKRFLALLQKIGIKLWPATV